MDFVASAVPCPMGERSNLKQIAGADRASATCRHQSGNWQRVVEFKTKPGNQLGMGRIWIEACRPGSESLQYCPAQLLCKRRRMAVWT